MLISAQTLKNWFEVQPNGVLHVGTHDAEEGDLYSGCDWGAVIWVQVLPQKANELQKRFAGSPGNIVIQTAYSNYSGESKMGHVASDAKSSTSPAPREGLTNCPDCTTSVMNISRLDEILEPHFSFEFLNIDTQGAGLKIIEGLGIRIHKTKWIYTRYAEKLYQGYPLIDDLDRYLAKIGFYRVVICPSQACSVLGDALYINLAYWPSESVVELRRRGKIFGNYTA